MTYNNSQTNYNANYYNNSGIYSGVPRGWLKFAQIAGTVLSVIGLITYIYYIKDIYNALPSNDLVKKSVTSLLLAVIVYFVWRTIYTAIIIVRLVNKYSDQELCANRYIISALSLSVGGFFTPFLMTSFPNVETTSTIKPRYFLSKVMGLCTLIGAPILMITYFFSLLVGANAVSPKLIFNTSTMMGTISVLVLAISVVTFILGLTTTKLFFANKTENEFVKNNYSNTLKVISTIWMAILTIELAIVILFSILRLIAAFLDLFRTREQGGGFIYAIFALFNLLVTISYVGMVIYITSRTIAGLWSINDVVTIKRYEHNSYTKNQLYGNNMNS